MLLAVDIGNTQTVLGVYDGDQLMRSWRLATRLSSTADELYLDLKGLLSLNVQPGQKTQNITATAIASVVPPLTEQWYKVGHSLTGAEPLVLTSSTDTGLTYRYRDPSEIGADRIADAVAAIALYGAPVIVVDFGTATNIEVIDKDGSFVGGIIAPGLTTSAEALFFAAARLPRIDIEIPDSVIGYDTKGAVQSGLTYGEIDRIDGLVERVFAELGYQCPVIATGGLSFRVLDLSRVITAVNESLTLEGLRLIFERQ
ncbi:MAG: type III pantothenate kinase [Coriobacteriales bacterium]|jgi:type III pantothenate kinase|nr:type III pantothenate kinase [Coriobacteriales bacterium]